MIIKSDYRPVTTKYIGYSNNEHPDCSTLSEENIASYCTPTDQLLDDIAPQRCCYL